MEAYPGEYEIYLFPDLARALTAVEKFHVRVLLIETNGEAPTSPDALLPSVFPASAIYFRLSNTMQEEKDWELQHARWERARALSPVSMKTDSWDNIPVLCRFRSTEEWHRQIQALVGENEAALDRAGELPALGAEQAEVSQMNARVCLFTAAGGGCGASTAALAFAECCANHHRQVFYLNLETIPGLDERFSSENLYTIEDVLLSLRGRKYAPDAVLEHALCEEENGVVYVRPPKDPSVLFDMTGEEVVTLIDLLRGSGKFSVIILDMSFDSSERVILPYLSADLAVLVSDGGSIANRKTMTLAETLPGLCSEDVLTLQEKTCLLYNRFKNGVSEVLPTEQFIKLGGIGELDLSNHRDLTGEIALSRPMERLYETLIR